MLYGPVIPCRSAIRATPGARSLREPAITGDGLSPRGRGEMGSPGQRGPQDSVTETGAGLAKRTHTPAEG
jgi:hypothetical protein